MTTAQQLADNFDYYKNNYFKFDGGTWRLFDKDDNFLYFDDHNIEGFIQVFINDNDTKFEWIEPMTDVECYDDSDIDSDSDFDSDVEGGKKRKIRKKRRKTRRKTKRSKKKQKKSKKTKSSKKRKTNRKH